MAIMAVKTNQLWLIMALITSQVWLIMALITNQLRQLWLVLPWLEEQAN